MWELIGEAVDVAHFGGLTPVEILYDFDGPRIFTLTDALGGLMLAYQCAEGDDAARFLVVPSDAATIDALRSGATTLRRALGQPWSWVVEQPFGVGELRAWRVDIATLPENALPRPWAHLRPEHDPLFAVRLVGEGLTEPYGVSASVVRRAVEGASQALKAIVDFVADRPQVTGRPLESVRRLYDLPVQQFRFASFEVAFSAPPPTRTPDLFSSEERALQAIGEILTKGLDWATSPDERDTEVSAEWATILDALRQLTPPRQGPVSEVHVGGRLVGRLSRPFVLDRAIATRVKKAHDRLSADHAPVKLRGVIREFDKDKQTFILRNSDGNWRCAVSEDLYDDALEAFTEDHTITVLGLESKSRGVINVLSIEAGVEAIVEAAAPDPSPEATL